MKSPSEDHQLPNSTSPGIASRRSWLRLLGFSLVPAGFALAALLVDPTPAPPVPPPPPPAPEPAATVAVVPPPVLEVEAEPLPASPPLVLPDPPAPEPTPDPPPPPPPAPMPAGGTVISQPTSAASQTAPKPFEGDRLNFRVFEEGYADTVWSHRFGYSALAQYTIGLTDGSNDVFLHATYDWATTSGSSVPYQSSQSGAILWVGARHWFFNHSTWLGALYGWGLTEDRRGNYELRLGGAGFWENWDDPLYRAHGWRRETYGEAFWVEPISDGFFMARHRYGPVLAEFKKGYVWAYGVGQLNLSVSGDNGADNRLEAGIGIGYLRPFTMGKYACRFTANAELREGTTLRGDTGGMTHTYFTPWLGLAVGFQH